MERKRGKKQKDREDIERRVERKRKRGGNRQERGKEKEKKGAERGVERKRKR